MPRFSIRSFPFAVLMLLTIATVAFAAEFLGNIQTTKIPTGFPVKGVTIGTYGCDYNGTGVKPFQQALIDGHKHLEVVNGAFVFTEVLSSAADDVTIVARSGVSFAINHSGSVGLFNLTGARASLINLRCLETTAVNDQKMIYISGPNSKVVNTTLVYNGPGTAANPQIGIHADNAMNVSLQDVTVLPSTGVIGAKISTGVGYRVDNFSVLSDINLDTPNIVIGANVRDMWMGLWLDNTDRKSVV
mgnify:CR=1 FL=1